MSIKLFGFAGTWPAAISTAALTEYADSLPGLPGPMAKLPERSSGLNGFVAAPYVAQTTDIVVAVAGFPGRPSPDSTADADPAAHVLSMYRERGVQFLDALHGRFAVAVLDARTFSVHLAIDPMGIERMAYGTAEEGIVFSSSVPAVARFPAIGAGVRPQAIYDYLLLHMVPAPDTIYEGVHKLRPGSTVEFRRGEARTRRYWLPHFVERGSAARFEELKEQLHRNLHEAVRATEPDSFTGAFLSGGLDSSTVAGMLARCQPGAAKTFSMGFGVDAYDELEFARIASRHFKTQAHEHQVTPDDVLEAFPKIAAQYDEPFGNSSAVPTYVCAKVAATEGVTHLIAGDGGDELFGGNERYVKQRIFEAYARLPAALRSGVIEPLPRLIAPESSLTPLRKLRSYVDQARIPLPERFETWNLVYRTGANSVLGPNFARLIDPRAPLALMQEVFDEVPDASLLHRMLFYDWQYTLSDNDLRKVSTMCELAGIRVSYPMLDPAVVDVALRVPSNMKIQGVELRSFYKQAMADFLPPEILSKRKHGFGLPFGVWLKSDARLAELIFGHIESLRRRAIMSPEFLDEIVAGHRNGDASYFGYPIWDMAMLDAWLGAHEVST